MLYLIKNYRIERAFSIYVSSFGAILGADLVNVGLGMARVHHSCRGRLRCSRRSALLSSLSECFDLRLHIAEGG